MVYLQKLEQKTVLIDRLIEFNKQQFVNNKSNKDIDLYEKIKIKNLDIMKIGINTIVINNCT